MRAMLLIALAACGAGSSGKARLRVEPLDDAAAAAPRPGADLPKVPETERRSYGSWLRRDGALYHVDSYEVARVDPVTGNDVWSVKGEFSQYDAQAGPATVWVPCDRGVCGLAAATGAPVATLPHANWPMLTPDGTTLVLQAPDGAGVYDAATGTLKWKAPPATANTRVNKTAVSDKWLAVLSSGRTDDDPDHVQVFAIDGGKPVWSVSSATGKYLEYVAAGGDLVVWYDSGDAGIHAVRLPDGARAKVFQLRETFVLSTDASGMAPAVPDEAPRVEGDRVMVKTFDKVHAFRVY